MANYSGAVILIEGVAKALAPGGAFISALTEPNNEGPWPVYLYTQGFEVHDPPALAALFGQGQKIAAGELVQWQDPSDSNDLAAWFGSVLPGQAPAPSAAIQAGTMCDTGDTAPGTGTPTVAWEVPAFTMPAVSSNVSVTVSSADATTIGTLPAGCAMWHSSGCIFQLVSISGTTLTMSNQGLGASRLSISA
jgi:hypothetical protein